MPKIKQVRLSHNETQTDIGILMNRDKRDVSKIENGTFFPNKEDIQILCQHYNCGVLDLFNMEELPFTVDEMRKLPVATLKKTVATLKTPRPRANTYNFCVRVYKGDFPHFTKTTIEKCGFRNNKEFLTWAIQELFKSNHWITKEQT